MNPGQQQISRSGLWMVTLWLLGLAPIHGDFLLISGFPPKSLEDPDKTVKNGDLIESNVTQKIV